MKAYLKLVLPTFRPGSTLPFDLKPERFIQKHNDLKKFFNFKQINKPGAL